MHERISVNAICFPGAGLGELTGYWRELGVSRASIYTQLLDDGVPAVRQALSDSGARLETISHVFAPGPLLGDREAVRRASAELSRVIAAAHELGGRSIYMLSGGRGDLTWEEAAEAFAEGIAPCLAQAKAAGIALAVEPTPPLYADAHLAYTLRDTVTLAETAGIGVCMDTFPSWGEAGLKATIERAAERLVLIQIGDYALGDRALPARAVPGDGAGRLDRMLGWALDAGYTGALELELLGPRIDKEGRLGACRRAIAWIEDLLRTRGD